MFEFEITRMGERGQVVIPKDIRTKVGLRAGSVIEIIESDNLLIMKKIEPRIRKADIKVLERLAKTWKEIEKGKFKRYTLPEFEERLLKGRL
jgi:AbrB family looped-hinge helix DNA binding protein